MKAFMVNINTNLIILNNIMNIILRVSDQWYKDLTRKN